MELRHLRYFMAAAEVENVSRAAVKLHLSQPALSRQIRDLEQEVGFALFERSPRSMHLTPAGKTFLEEVRAVLQRVEDAVNRARAVATGGQAELHVGYAPSPMVRIMPPALRVFQAESPGVRVRLHDLSTEEMLSGVRDGKLELAFLVRPNRARLRGLHFEELARESMCLTVPPSHELARAGSVSLAQASRLPLVTFSRKEYPEYHEYLEALFASVKPRLRITEEHDSASSLIAAVESGAGVAIVPRSFSCSAGPRLTLLPLTPEPERIVLGAVWPDAGLKPLAERFWKSSKQAVSGGTGISPAPAPKPKGPQKHHAKAHARKK
jgi:LysR family transcriptional regulator, benzoate and cis,cis-muconate-responsive activator of ben and cat genes